MIFTSRFVPYSAIALYPFIFIRHEELRHNESLIRHEKIHHKQQVELLLIGFYVLYGINYLYNLLRYRNHYKAYREIIFEREAYAMDNDPGYLKRRKVLSFLNYTKANTTAG
jgi:hypothetical protein